MCVCMHSTIRGKLHEAKDYAYLGPHYTPNTKYPVVANKLSSAAQLWRAPLLAVGHLTFHITSSNVWTSLGVS